MTRTWYTYCFSYRTKARSSMAPPCPRRLGGQAQLASIGHPHRASTRIRPIHCDRMFLFRVQEGGDGYAGRIRTAL